MSIVNTSVFDPNATPEEVYNIVNSLPVSYWLFSQNTNYFARLFGVLTGERNEQDWTDFTINHCLRDALWSTLRSITDDAENYVGYNLSTRYHKKTISFPFDKKIKVYPGIEITDVTQQWSDIVGYDQIVVDPFILRSATVNVGPPPTVEIPDNILDNPLNVILRRGSDNGTYSIDDTVIPFKSGSNWVLTLDNDTIPYTVGDDVNVQSVRYVYVDITPPITCENGTIYPVYPGTNQIIPQAKPVQQLLNGDDRYWFYIYTLVDPAFYNNTVDLIDAEFYKLLPYISFKCLTEIELKGRLEKTCICPDCSGCRTCCEDQVFQVSTHVEDSERGIVSFCIDGELVVEDDVEVLQPTSCNCLSCDSCHRYILTFYYKTNPDFLSERIQKGIGEIERAVVFRVAADLPIIDCGCFLNRPDERLGFIFRQQETFAKTSVNSFTGTVITLHDYGDLRGQRAYSEIIAKAPKLKAAFL
jgi:hypothetical protein